MNSEILCKQFIERGFHEKEFKKTIMQVAKIDKNELLRDRIRENKDPQTVKKFQTETYCHLPKKQIPFRSPLEEQYCKSATSFQHNTLWKTQTLHPNEYSQTHH